MEREDLISYLGTIARSGTKEFVKAMQEAASSKNGDLIGQFSVGFYSVFRTADKISPSKQERPALTRAGHGNLKAKPAYPHNNRRKPRIERADNLHMKKNETKEASKTIIEWT